MGWTRNGGCKCHTVHLSSPRPQEENGDALYRCQKVAKNDISHDLSNRCQVTENQRLFWISTKSVNNCVEKRGLDTLDAASRAAFNNLPIGKAISFPLKIKGLQDLTPADTVCTTNKYCGNFGGDLEFRSRSGDRPTARRFEQDALDHLGPYPMRLEILERRHGAAFAQGGDAARHDVSLAGVAPELGGPGEALIDILGTVWTHGGLRWVMSLTHHEY